MVCGCLNGILVSSNPSIADLCYVDDLASMEESAADLQSFIDKLDCYGKITGLNVSIKKAKVMTDFPINISLRGRNHQTG